mmetsp:Transcript_4032/g.6203  ORF Transcript_4032/g.6203 Transcript_4032/m.6203 type:complete len:754 (-) Transcript_4032:229-2490(-)
MKSNSSTSAPDLPVVIVGGGIAGLLCFHRLIRAGVQCHLFEAGPHFGGRLTSVFRSPFAKSFRVLRSHHATVALCQELHIPLIRHLPSDTQHPSQNAGPPSMELDRNLEHCMASLNHLPAAPLGQRLPPEPADAKQYGTLSAKALLSPELGSAQDSWAYDGHGPLLHLVQNAETRAAEKQIAAILRCSQSGDPVYLNSAAELVRKLLTVPADLQDHCNRCSVSVNAKVTEVNVAVDTGFSVALASGSVLKASAVVLAAPLTQTRFSVLVGTDLDPEFANPRPVTVVAVTAHLVFASTQKAAAFENAKYVLPSPLRWFEHLSGSTFCVAKASGTEANLLVSLHRSGNLTRYVKSQMAQTFGSGVSVRRCDLFLWESAHHFWQAGRSVTSDTYSQTGLFLCGESTAHPVVQGWLEGAVASAEKVVKQIMRFRQQKPPDPALEIQNFFGPQKFIQVWSPSRFLEELAKRGPLLAKPERKDVIGMPRFVLLHRHVIDVPWLMAHWPRNLLPERLLNVAEDLSRCFSVRTTAAPLGYQNPEAFAPPPFSTDPTLPYAHRQDPHLANGSVPDGEPVTIEDGRRFPIVSATSGSNGAVSVNNNVNTNVNSNDHPPFHEPYLPSQVQPVPGQAYSHQQDAFLQPARKEFPTVPETGPSTYGFFPGPVPGHGHLKFQAPEVVPNAYLFNGPFALPCPTSVSFSNPNGYPPPKIRTDVVWKGPCETQKDVVQMLDMTSHFRPIQVQSNRIGWILQNAVAILGY